MISKSASQIAIRAITAALIVAGLIGLIFGFQTYSWYKAGQMRKSTPNLSLIPQPLNLRDESKEPGSKITDFGYEFEVPWPPFTKARKVGAVSDYLFPPGDRGLIFLSSYLLSPKTASLSPPEQQVIREIQGYQLMKATLNATPEQMSPFLSMSEAKGRFSWLNLKEGLYGRRDVSAFYSFDRGDLRGFQIGNPARDKSVELDSFNATGWGTMMILESKGESGLSQLEINRVINTLHSVDKRSEASQ